MNKFFFYLFFITLGTICVEVLSTNAISFIWYPWGYLIYGLLYIFFIDYIFRKQISSWKTIYLFGMLVGFITEAYVAKVVFFGWPDNNFIFHGFAVKEIIMLIFFFHPLLAFLLPIWIAKNFFGLPFAVKKSRRKWMIYLLPLYPVIGSSSVGLVYSPKLAITAFITLVIFTIITLLFYKYRQVKNILLTKKQKIITFVAFLAFYILFYLKTPVYRREFVMLPEIIPLLISFVVAGLIFFLIWIRTKKIKDIKFLESKKQFNIKKTLAYFAFFYLTVMILFFLKTGFETFVYAILAGFILSGTIMGFIYFINVITDTLKISFKKN